MPKALDSAARAIIDRLDAPELTLDALVERLAAAGVHVSRSAVYRHRKARQAAAPASAPDVAARVAALAPPPAPEPAPPLAFGGDVDEQVRALGAIGQRLMATAERARAGGDVAGEARALSEAGAIAGQIRLLDKTRAAATGGRHYSADEIAAAGIEVRRRLDELAAARGEANIWTLDAVIPPEHGGPKLRGAS